VVHYTTDDPADAVPADAVAGILGVAERAYAVEVNDETGFGPPLDDGDARTDIYVHHLEEDAALTRGDRPTPQRPNQASAYIELDPGSAVKQGYQGALHYLLPHEFFHVLQFAFSGREALWMAEATAEWAARSPAGIDFYARPEENWFVNPNQPLDCFEESCGGTPTEERATQGYDRWAFFRYLEERFGHRIVYEIWTHSRALSEDGGPHPLEAIDGALRARDTSLSELFGEFVPFAATAGWQLEYLRRWTPTPVVTLRAGRVQTSQSARLQIAHLAASYVAVTGGGPPGSLSICMPARLRLDVTQPAGQAESPAFLLTGRAGPPIELVGEGAQRSIDVPWRTCQEATGTLALPNTSWTLGAPFDLTARITPARRLWLPRGDPALSFYLELPVKTRVRTELTVPPARRGRPPRQIVRSRLVREGAVPVSLRLPPNGPDGRYRLSVRYRKAGVPTEARRTFSVRFR
jgi:hypothetical protein